MEYMKDKPDKYYELAIVDPPYGVGKDKSNQIIINNKTWKNARNTDNLKNKNWDKKKPNSNYFKELFRISKNQIIWGANNFVNFLPISTGWGIWDKKVVNSMFSPFELYFTSFNKMKKFEYMYEGYKRPAGEIKEIRIHPTQKPVALYKWLLTNYAKEGDKIFDSHVGSGSSRIAAYELGFHFEGCELDKDYHKDQELRFYEFKKKFHNEFYIPDEDNLLFRGL
jgi:site-specific DNA-methyltransferase (adenine-specific)